MSAAPPGRAWLRLSSRLAGRTKLILEPWATEYPLAPGHPYEILVEGEFASPGSAVEVELRDDAVVVYAPSAGSMLRVFDGGVELP